MSAPTCDHTNALLVRLHDGTFRCRTCGARIKFLGELAREVEALFGESVRTW